MFTRNRRRSSGAISNYGQSAQVELLENRLLLTAPVVLSPRGDVATLNPLIEWTPVEGAASYNVWVAENGQQAGLLTEYTGTQGFPSQTSALISQTMPDRPSVDPLIDTAHYRIWVQAVFGDDTRGAWSASQDFTHLPDGHHLPLAISLQELQKTQTPRVEWGEPRVLNSVVERYELYINAVGKRSTPSYHRTQLSERQHVLDTPIPDGSYEVWVRAHMKDRSETRWGVPRELTLVTESVPKFRPVMEFLAPANISDATPQIRWEDAGSSHGLAVDRYDLYINLQGDRQEVYRRQHLPGGTLEHEVEVALAGNKTYEVWVRAFLRDGSVTRWGGSGQLMAVSDPVPDFEDVVPVLSVTGTTASWDAVDTASRYEVWVNEYDSNGALLKKLSYYAWSVETLHEMDLSSGHYRAWIRAFGPTVSTVRSRWSAAVSFSV